MPLGERGTGGTIVRSHPRVLDEVAQALDARPDVLLVSAYLQHHRSVVEIGRLAAERGVPLLLGGPVFNHASIADAWREVPGVRAIVGAEVDLVLPDLVREIVNEGDPLRFAGVTLPDGRRSDPAPPLRELDRLPIPDFSDFPSGALSPPRDSGHDRARMPVESVRVLQRRALRGDADVPDAFGRSDPGRVGGAGGAA